MTRPLHVAFVWHMHQPYYKDDLQNQFLLPWVRLRCAKDYYKMPALLADYPAIKQNAVLLKHGADNQAAKVKAGSDINTAIGDYKSAHPK